MARRKPLGGIVVGDMIVVKRICKNRALKICRVS